jgi:hypothetical protein
MASGINLIKIKTNDLPTLPIKEYPSEDKRRIVTWLLVKFYYLKSLNERLYHILEVIVYNIHCSAFLLLFVNACVLLARVMPLCLLMYQYGHP